MDKEAGERDREGRGLTTALWLVVAVGLAAGIGWVWPSVSLWGAWLGLVAEAVYHGPGPLWMDYAPWIIGMAFLLPAVWERRFWQAVRAQDRALWGFFAAWGVWVLLTSHFSPISHGVAFDLGSFGAALVNLVGLPLVVALRQEWRTVFRLMVVVALGFGWYALAALWFAHRGMAVPLGHHVVEALAGPFNKNTLGILIWYGLAAAVFLALVEAGPERWLWAGFALVLAGLELGTVARSSWVAAAVAVWLLVWLLRPRWGRIVTAAGLVAVAAVAAAAHRLVHELVARGLSGRPVLWAAAVRFVNHGHWIFGAGYGNGTAAIAALLPPAFRGLSPTSTYLTLLVELGLPGLLLVGGLFGWALVRLVRPRATGLGDPFRQGVLALLVAALVQGLAETFYLGGVTFVHAYLAVLLGFALVRVSGRAAGAAVTPEPAHSADASRPAPSVRQ
jgi:O-antigen ligase